MFLRTVIAVTLIAVPAVAEPVKPKDAAPKIDGTFGFDVMKPRTRCSKITGALLTRLRKDYTCAPPTTGSASGVAAAASCSAKKGESTYMLFTAQADCEKERETQLANGA